MQRLSTVLCILGLISLAACKPKKKENQLIFQDSPSEIQVQQNALKNTLVERFSCPQGFIRQEADVLSFAHYLRSFPLLDQDEKVHLYDGSLKGDQSVHAAVLDIDVGSRDLQQCADAVMRLRAEFLFAQKRYDEIGFDFTNGWHFGYSTWRKGNDLEIDGNQTRWKTAPNPKTSYDQFRTYMDWVFMYAGTLSLSKELKPKSIDQVDIGDVFIFGGSPGHAVLVMDVSYESATGDKAIILAQSYMPAQQIHIIKNKENPQISPWYKLSEIDDVLKTPEWTFLSNALKTW